MTVSHLDSEDYTGFDGHFDPSWLKADSMATGPDPLAASISCFDPDTDPAQTGARWDKWLLRFETYLVAKEITKDEIKKANLLLRAGSKVFDIYDTLSAAADKYEDLKKKLTEHFKPMKDPAVAVYLFREEKQKPGETVDQYVTRLKALAKNCEFEDRSDAEIRAQVLQNTSNGELRREILKHPVWKLADVLKEARSLEASEARATEIERDSNSKVNQVDSHSVDSVRASSHSGARPKRGKPNPKFKKTPVQRQETVVSKQSSASDSRKQSCFNCGGAWPHVGVCPAKNRKCNKCKQIGHYGKVCPKYKSQKVNTLPLELNQDDQYVFGVSGVKPGLPHVTLRVAGKLIDFLVDTGANPDIIDQKTYQEIGKPKLSQSEKNHRAFSYASSQEIPFMGNLDCTLETLEGKMCKTELRVTKAENSGNLIGFETSKKLGLVKFNEVVKVNQVTQPSHTDLLINKFSDIFEGIGKLKDFKAHIHLDENVEPVIQPQRRIPFHLRKKVEQELERLKAADIIEEAKGPTTWLSPAVFVEKKSGDIRLCIDSRRVNEAVIRERYQGPTIHELVYDLNGATVFSTIDMREGFHQLELDEESRDVTTFSTHIGNFRYKRLIYGISSAPELFQKMIAQTIADIPRCRNIADDIIVYGATQAEHDSSMEALFERLKLKGLTLRREKCKFNQTQVKFYGFCWEGGRLKPDPEKVSAIEQLKRPEDATQLRSILGMTNYCARFIPRYSDITAALRELTHQGTPWCWTDRQEKAFLQLKEALVSKPTLSYFDPKKKTIILTDASPVGVSAILTQQDESDNNGTTVVAYASRALSPVEQRYPQTDREALGVVWACEHFHLYVYGQPFTVLTDHKALVQIYGNPKLKTTARLERYALRLSPYQVNVQYRPGHDNPADYMSRDPLPNKTGDIQETDHFVNFIASNCVPKTLMFEEIKTATLEDPTLQEVIKRIQSGKWEEDFPSHVNGNMLDRYRCIKQELCASTDRDFILRGNRIVIPEALQSRVLALAHEGHLGLVKLKQLLREKVWFPYIDTKAEAMVKDCLACQASTGTKSSKEPLKMSVLPQGIWQEISIDFWGPTPDGIYALVIIDDYSRFPIVEFTTSTSADTVIPLLDKVFSEWGIPFELRTDNGPPFQSAKFEEFCRWIGVRHRKITPLWPQANGEAERFMKNLNKVSAAATAEGRCWKQEIFKFLRNYRSAPHPSTGRPPCVLMLNRPVRIKIPCVLDSVGPGNDDTIRRTDYTAKEKMAKYAMGQKVLVKQRKMNKFSTKYDPDYYVVTENNGSMVTAKRPDGKTITRNVSFFKPYGGTQVFQKDYTGKTRSSVSVRDDRNESTNLPVVTVPETVPPTVPQAVPETVPQTLDVPRMPTIPSPAKTTQTVEVTGRTTRSGRVSKGPTWFKDFEMK